MVGLGREDSSGIKLAKLAKRTAVPVLYAVVDIELPPPDHNCGPDCYCWNVTKDEL